jgi:hypothetical protein
MSNFNQKEYKRLKGRLTRAINSGDSRKIMDEAASGMLAFEDTGFPDDWSRWQRAYDDAQMKLNYANNGW